MKTARTISASRKPCAAGTPARPSSATMVASKMPMPPSEIGTGARDRRRRAGQHDGRQADAIADVRQDQPPDREDQRDVDDARRPEAERGAAVAAHAGLHAAGLDQDGGEQAPRRLQQAAAGDVAVGGAPAEPIENEDQQRDADGAGGDDERAQPGLQPRHRQQRGERGQQHIERELHQAFVGDRADRGRGAAASLGEQHHPQAVRAQRARQEVAEEQSGEHAVPRARPGFAHAQHVEQRAPAQHQRRLRAETAKGDDEHRAERQRGGGFAQLGPIDDGDQCREQGEADARSAAPASANAAERGAVAAGRHASRADQHAGSPLPQLLGEGWDGGMPLLRVALSARAIAALPPIPPPKLVGSQGYAAFPRKGEGDSARSRHTS